MIQLDPAEITSVVYHQYGKKCIICDHLYDVQIGHLYSKSSYPLLAVLPANLFPSCGTCLGEMNAFSTLKKAYHLVNNCNSKNLTRVVKNLAHLNENAEILYEIEPIRLSDLLEDTTAPKAKINYTSHAVEQLYGLAQVKSQYMRISLAIFWAF